MSSSSSPATKSNIDDLRKELIITIPAVGAVLLVCLIIIIGIVIGMCRRVSGLRKELELIHISLRSVEKIMSQTQGAIEKFPKSIVQFPMTKSSFIDDEDRAGTEPASPLFYQKGYYPPPLASSLTSVTEMPGEYQTAHHLLQRNNAMLPVRIRQPGPPVPPKRTQSFNSNNSFKY